MKTFLNITLIIGLILSLGIFNLLVYTEEPPETTLDEIVVTAHRTSQPYSELPDNISIITAKELSRMPVNDLAEALNLVTGVDLQARGPLGSPTSVTIQGCDPRHVRIMVDGVLIDSQGTAFADPSQVPIENVERIEIIKGTASALWGSSLGGVINVVTKSPQEKQGNLTFSGGWGDYGFWKRVLELSGQIGKFRYLVWESNLNTNSEFRSNSEILNQKASAKFTYLFSDQANLEASFHYNSADMGGFEFDTLGYGEDLFYNTRYGSIKLSLLPKDGVEFTATGKFSEQDSTIERFLLTTGNVTRVASKNTFGGLDLQSKFRLAKNQNLLVGVDLGRDQYDSDQIKHIETLRRQGYYANYNLLIGEKYSITLGSRYDDNDAYGEQFSPSAGLVYHLPYANTHLRISLAKAFNAPPLLYKYVWGNAFLRANDDLKAERAWVYELSAETSPLPRLWLKAAAYRAEVKDFVSFITVAPWVSQADNIDKTRRQGIESELKYTVMDGLQMQGGWSLNRIQNRKTGKIIQGVKVARVTYNLGLNYNYEHKLNLNLKGNYRFWNEAKTNKAKDRRFIWDLLANYDVSSLINAESDQKISLFLGIYNIFNRKHWYHQLLPLPGRRVELGLNYTF